MIIRPLAICLLLVGCVAPSAPVGPPQAATDCKARYDQARNADYVPTPETRGAFSGQTIGRSEAEAINKSLLKQCLADAGAMSGIIPANSSDVTAPVPTAAKPRKIPAQSRPQPVRRSADPVGCNLELSGGSGYVCRSPRY